MSEQGWAFSDAFPDRVNGFSYLHQVYNRARSRYSGRVTVPVLWDRQRETIVNNESSEIIRMLNSEFGAVVPRGHDYYPPALRADRRDQRYRVRQREQRRVSLRIRRHAGGV
jgi:putative glutathione S-transferase